MPRSTSSRTSSDQGVADNIFADDLAFAAARCLALSPAASMQELADASGVSRATLFRRFPSRGTLVAELCVSVAEAYLRAIDQARPESGPPSEALERVVAAIADLAPVFGLIGLQPLTKHLESDLLAAAHDVEQRLRTLLRRGQQDGSFSVEVDPEWLLAILTWLPVAVADSVRFGRLTAGAARHHFAMTVIATLRRSPQASLPHT